MFGDSWLTPGVLYTGGRVMLRKRREASCRSAFTLIELIVIVVILLIGAVLMIPLFVNARTNRLKETCLSDLREVGSGLILYDIDSDDTLPMAHYEPGSRVKTSFACLSGAGQAPICWPDLIFGYVRSPDFFDCPSDASEPRGPDKPLRGRKLSYALNAYFYHQPGVNRETLTGGGLFELRDTPDTLLAVESDRPEGAIVATPATVGSAWSRHFDGANWLMADGHVEFHGASAAIKSVARAVWPDPATAAKQPFAQWFPWLSSKHPVW